MTTIKHGDQWLAAIPAKGTREQYRYCLRVFAQFLTSNYKRSYGNDVLLKYNDWLVSAEYARSTIQLYLAAVKAFIGWQVAHDHLRGLDLSLAINKLSAGARQRGTSEARDADPRLPEILAYYDDLTLPDGAHEYVKRMLIMRDRAIVHALFSTGARVSEVVSINRDEAGKQRVQITGKGNKKRTIIFGDVARDRIAQYLDARGKSDPFVPLFISHGRGGGAGGKRLGRHSYNRIVRVAARALHLDPKTSPHAFRHYRAQAMLDAGTPLDVLQSYLGHVSINTTRQVYAPHTAIDVVEQAALADL